MLAIWASATLDRATDPMPLRDQFGVQIRGLMVERERRSWEPLQHVDRDGLEVPLTATRRHEPQTEPQFRDRDRGQVRVLLKAGEPAQNDGLGAHADELGGHVRVEDDPLVERQDARHLGTGRYRQIRPAGLLHARPQLGQPICLVQLLGRASRQEVSRLRLHGPAVPCGAALQPFLHLGVEAANENLSHWDLLRLLLS